jgi:hypothetical protein
MTTAQELGFECCLAWGSDIDVDVDGHTKPDRRVSRRRRCQPSYQVSGVDLQGVLCEQLRVAISISYRHTSSSTSAFGALATLFI